MTSAMVYGARADNPVPLAEDAPAARRPDGPVVSATCSRSRHRWRGARRVHPGPDGHRPAARGARRARASTAWSPGTSRRRGCSWSGLRARAGSSATSTTSSRALELAALGAVTRRGHGRLRRARSTRPRSRSSPACAGSSCPPRSRSARPSGCTGSASRRRRRATWRTSSTVGRPVDAAAGGGLAPAYDNATALRRCWEQVERPRAGRAAGPRRHARRGGSHGRRGRHRGPGPADPPAPRRRADGKSYGRDDETPIRSGSSCATTPLSVDEVLAAVADPAAGGTAVFVGHRARPRRGPAVGGLDYTAHPTAAGACGRSPSGSRRAPGRRAGRRAPRGPSRGGDLAVVVAAARAPREAFEAGRRLIDDLKHERADLEAPALRRRLRGVGGGLRLTARPGRRVPSTHAGDGVVVWCRSSPSWSRWCWVSLANRPRPPADPHDSIAEHERFRQAMERAVARRRRRPRPGPRSVAAPGADLPAWSA